MEGALSTVAEARAELESARADELAATDKASSLGARRAALEQLERDREGVEPAVKAALRTNVDVALTLFRRAS